MKQTKIPQHVRINQETLKNKQLNTQDMTVLANIKKYMDKNTFYAYPSIDTLIKNTGLSKKVILKCIKNLVVNNELEIITDPEIKNKVIELSIYRKNNLYKLNPQSEHYEMYSYDFLQDETTKPDQKGYLIKAQSIMFKENGYGTICYSNRELSELLNIPRTTINKYNAEFSKLGLLTTLPINNGEEIILKKFDLNKIGQAFVTILTNHENQIQSNTLEIQKLKERISELEKQNAFNIFSL